MTESPSLLISTPEVCSVMRFTKVITSGATQPELTKRYENHKQWFTHKNFEALLKQAAQAKINEVARIKEEILEREKMKMTAESRARVNEWLERKRLQELAKLKVSSADEQAKRRLYDEAKTFELWLKEKNELRKKEANVKAFTTDLDLNGTTATAERRAQAEASYEEWIKKISLKPLNLPRNGFQIFSPQPAPVVKVEWIDCLPTEEPKSTQSLPCLPVRPLYEIKSFRSETNVVPKLKLADSALIPWSWRRGAELRMGYDSSQRTFIVKPAKKNLNSKKKPPFR